MADPQDDSTGAQNWSRRRLLATGSAAAGTAVAATATLGSSAQAAPATGIAQGVGMVHSISGQRVMVRPRSAPDLDQFHPAAVAAVAEPMFYGWSLRAGDLVVLEDRQTGTPVAVPLHREVAGRVSAIDGRQITVAGQACGLDSRTLLYRDNATEPVVGATDAYVREGDTVAMQCLDSRTERTLTVHFLRLMKQA